MGQGVLLRQAFSDAATRGELNTWKRVLHLSLLAPSSWQRSAQSLDSYTGSTILVELARERCTIFSSMGRSRDCWLVRRYCSTESASERSPIWAWPSTIRDKSTRPSPWHRAPRYTPTPRLVSISRA